MVYSTKNVGTPVNLIYNYYVFEKGNWAATTLDAKYNWWGSTDIEVISNSIVDYNYTDNLAGVVDYSLFLDSENGSPIQKAPNGETYLIGSVNENTTLSGHYIVPKHIRINSGELKILQGTTFKFLPDAFIVVAGDGIMTAGSSSGAPVTFSSFSSERWNGIKLQYNSKTNLDNCIIENTEIGILVNNGTTPQITNCKIRYNENGIKLYNYNGIRPGISMSMSSLYGNSSYNIFTGKYVYDWNTSTLDVRNNWWGTADPVEINNTIYDYFDNTGMPAVDFSSFLDAENGSPITKSPDGLTYLIGGTLEDRTLSGSYVVPFYYRIQDDKVNITPGTDIRFMTGASFIVSRGGSLVAGDVSGNPVTFTSAATTPAPGDWNGIFFFDESVGNLTNCIVQYADTGINASNRTSPQVLNCILRHNRIGVEVYIYDPRFIPDPELILENSSLYENQEYNYYVNLHNTLIGGWSSTVLNVQNNWWGTLDPNGISETIYDYTDRSTLAIVDFFPFLDSQMNVANPLFFPAGNAPNLADEISVLQLLSGLIPTDIPQIDFDGNDQIGLPEAIGILQYVAGLRSGTTVAECISNGVIFTDMTLTKENSPYIIENDIRVLPGVLLTIEPGVELIFEGYDQLWIDGAIEAVGTETEKIRFTSGKAAPSPGNWRGIYFGEGAVGNISYAVIEYAKRGIDCFAASPEITYNTLQKNELGIYAKQSSPQIIGNEITGNYNGIYLEDESMPVIAGNSILNNGDGISSFNLKVNNYRNANTKFINAQNNWWGTTARSEIDQLIYDYTDLTTSAHVVFDPILQSAGGNPIESISIIKNVTASPVFFTPASGETAAISYQLEEQTSVTLEIYKTIIELSGWNVTYQRELFRTLVNNESQAAGQHTVMWDGRNGSGELAESCAYVYVIKTDSGNNLIDLYDPLYVSGSVDISDRSVTPSTYDPYANEKLEIKYTLFAPAWMTIRWNLGYVLKAEPRSAGPHVEIWEAKDENGQIVVSDANIGAKAEIMPENVIVVKPDESFQITDVTTEAYVIIPAYGEISTVKYSITKDAAVSIAISDPNGNNWTLLASENQAQGTHSIEWNGENADGKLVWPWADGPEGDYTVYITAVDGLTGESVTETANIHVYR